MATKRKSSNAVLAFERDWKRFKARADLSDHCECGKGDGCYCFMGNAGGRALFANHINFMDTLRNMHCAKVSWLHNLHNDIFRRVRGELYECQCVIEDCYCLCNKEHPYHNELYTQWEGERDRLIKSWNKTLVKEGIPVDDEEFHIASDWGQKTFYSKPSPPHYTPTSPSDSPLYGMEREEGEVSPS